MKDRMPGKRFIYKLLNLSTRGAVNLSNTKYDVDKLKQLMCLYDALCASSEVPTLPSFLQRPDVLQIYGMDSFPEKEVRAPCRSTIHLAVQRGDIPQYLMAPDGYRRSITELSRDPAVAKAVKLSLRERRERKKQTGIIEQASTAACNMPPQLDLDQRFKSIALFSNISWQNFDRFGNLIHSLSLLILKSWFWTRFDLSTGPRCLALSRFHRSLFEKLEHGRIHAELGNCR
jgi:hypothetical protein